MKIDVKNVTRIRRTVIGCLFLGLLAAMLGCHGPRPRYALLFREDMSAELWKFPGKENDAEPSDKEQCTKEICRNESCAEESCLPTSDPPCLDCSNHPNLCSRPLCKRPRRMGGMGRSGASGAEEARPPEPPPMVAASFFPVPTRPVFTPRGNLMNLNPHLKGIVAGPSFEVVPQGMVSPEAVSRPAPKVEVLPSPKPDMLMLPQPASTGSSTASNQTSSSSWMFLKKAKKKPEAEKAYELIASGSQVMR